MRKGWTPLASVYLAPSDSQASRRPRVLDLDSPSRLTGPIQSDSGAAVL